jgi:uncharacterized protein (TIGR03437 family)
MKSLVARASKLGAMMACRLVMVWAVPFLALLLPGVCAAQSSVIFGNISSCGSNCGGALLEGSNAPQLKGIPPQPVFSLAAQFMLAAASLATDARVPVEPGCSDFVSGTTSETGCDDFNFNVAIFSDAGGVPGEAVSQIVTGLMAPPPFGGNVIASFAQPVALKAGTPYWLVLTPADTTSVVAWDGGGVPTVPVAATHSPTGTGGWYLSPTSFLGQPINLEFEVDGTTPAVDNPAPAITAVSPVSATTGGPAFTLTVDGLGFVQCAATPCLGVYFRSTFFPGQANAAGTQLTATIPALYIAAAGTFPVTVLTAWGPSKVSGAASNSLPFTIVNVTPAITLLSPASGVAGGPAFTLTVSGSSFFQCATTCLGVNWQPVGGSPTFVAAQASADGTQLTATIPAALIDQAYVVNVTVQAAGGTSGPLQFIVGGTTTTTTGGQTGAGHLLFPNVGLKSLQEFDPVKRVVVNTIPLPAPFSYSNGFYPQVISTALIRRSDGGILTNVYLNGDGAVVALSNSGQFVAAEGPVPVGSVQELAFDPLDTTQSTVLGGSPFGPNVIAVNPYDGELSTRITQQGATYTGLAIDSVGRLYTGDSAAGQIFRYLANGTQGILFADVLQATGSSEIGALAIDSSNNVYAAQGGSNRIAKFGGAGTFLNYLTDPGFNASANVYFNPSDGLLYVGDQADDALTILTTAGTPVAVVHMGGLAVGVPGLVPGAPAVAQAGMETTLTGLTFQTPQGGSAPPPQGFTLANNTSAALSFTTKLSTTSGGSWLSLSGGGPVAAGQVSAPITVSVNPSGLAAGDYYGLIEIDAAGVSNSPQFVSVVLDVLASAANPGAFVTPTGMIFTAAVSGANPAVQSVAVSDVLSRSTSFTAAGSVTAGPSWFTVAPLQGVIQPGQTANIQVQPNVGNLPAGVYSGTLTLQFPQDNVTRQIQLLLVVATSATEVAQHRPAPRQAIVPCQPTQLLMLFTELGAGFSQFASWPTTLETFVVDDCGVPMVSGSVIVSFSDGETAVPLISQGAGNWLQTWTASSAATTTLTLTASAVNSQGLQGSAPIGGTLQPNPDIPVLNVQGMVSAASYSPTATPSPGELVAVFGSNLADGTQEAGQLPLPTQMQNASVTVGGVPMPILYASPTQINAVVPYGLVGGQQAVAQHGDRLSVPQRVALGSADPAVFTTNASGQGQGQIYVIPPPSYTAQILANSANPATAGDILTVYCTGLGAVSGSVTAGTGAPSNPPAKVIRTVSVTIGGQPAALGFAGLAPGFAGLYQINATVPNGVPTGPDIPVVIMVGGVNSPPVTIAVK